jgi:hypothetical protein
MNNRRVFTVVAVTVLALVLTAAPAYALHTAYQGSDYAETTGDHAGIWACDKEADGHGVWAEYYDFTLRLYPALVDPNGSKPGCAFSDIDPQRIYQFRVCERYVACSGWKYPYGR